MMQVLPRVPELPSGKQLVTTVQWSTVQWNKEQPHACVWSVCCHNSVVVLDYYCCVKLICILQYYTLYISHSLSLEDCTVIGALKTVHLEAEIQREVFRRFRITTETASTFFRAIIKGETYYSRAYNRSKMRNSYTVEYIANGQQKFGYIEYFISFMSHTAVVVKPHTPTQDFCYPASLGVLRTNIVPVRVGSAITVISPSNILHKCVCMQLPHCTYIARLPNNVCTDWIFIELSQSRACCVDTWVLR